MDRTRSATVSIRGTCLLRCVIDRVCCEQFRWLCGKRHDDLYDLSDMKAKASSSRTNTPHLVPLKHRSASISVRR